MSRDMVRRRATSRVWREKNAAHLKALRFAHYHANPEKYKALSRVSSRAYRLKVRNALLDMYGRECECCGEDTVEFLAIDHKNGGGAKQRQEMKTHYAYYKWLLALGKKRSGFRVLCHNCNYAEHFCEGGCPHKRKKCGSAKNAVNTSQTVNAGRVAKSVVEAIRRRK